MLFPRLVLAEEVRRLIMLSRSLSGVKYGFFLGLLFAGVSTYAEFEGKKSKWKGYTKTDFKVGEYAAYVVEPRTIAQGKPWVWRARFPTFHTEIDELVLYDPVVSWSVCFDF